MSRQSEHPHTGLFIRLAVWRVTRRGIAGFCWGYGEWVRGYVVAVLEREPGCARITWRVNGGEVQKRDISLAYTRPNYGGRRAWFSCPNCGRRVGMLYMPVAGVYRWACRHCFRLRYLTQRLTTRWRMREKCNGITRRLGDTSDLPDSFPDKPKGMHWRTYERLYRRWYATADLYDAMQWVSFGRLLDRKGFFTDAEREALGLA